MPTRVRLDSSTKSVWLEGEPVYAAGNGPEVGVITLTGVDDSGPWAEVELTPEARGLQSDEEDPFG